MLSRVATRGLMRGSMAVSRMVKPGNHTCFCGCTDGKHFGRSLVQMQQRNFQDKLNLASMDDLLPVDYKAEDQVALWKEIADKNEKALILKTQDEITDYVLSVVRNYFRTTKKSSVHVESNFADHGLDSLDTIELVIQIEDELGYLIDAEKLELFKKPKHFVNFIAQMEAYKTEHNRLPHEGIYEDFEIKKHFPGLPSLGH